MEIFDSILFFCYHRSLMKKFLSTKSLFSKRTRLIFLVLGILFFITFFLFTELVKTDILRQWDFNITVKLQNHVPKTMDPFFSFLSIIGRFEATLITLLIFLLFRKRVLGLVVAFIFGFQHIFEVVGKTLLSQPGPPHMFLRTSDLASQFPGLYVHTGASYPSGHAMRAIFLCILFIFTLLHIKKLSPLSKTILSGVFIFFYILMATSRVSLGEHWSTDVIGGTLLGASAAFISLLFL